MTVADPCAAAPRPGGSDGEPEPDRSTAHPGVPAQFRPAGDRRADQDEPPAGLGPWVPPLPAARPPLSPRALTWVGIAAVLLIIGAATATLAVVGEAIASAPASDDARYLGSVRGNSTLTGLEVDDEALVRAGHAVCGTLDRRPSLSTVLITMHELGRANGWSGDDTAAVVGSAIGVYCPGHMAVLNA